MGFNYLKATEPLRGDSLLFTTKFLTSGFEHATPAHLPPGFESAFFKKGYLLISGGVTDVRIKHIYHKDSKTTYTEREMQLMLDFLIENSTKERFDGAEDMH